MEGHSSEHTANGNQPTPEPAPPAEAEGNADPATSRSGGSETRRTDEDPAREADSPAGESDAPVLEAEPAGGDAGADEGAKDATPAGTEVVNAGDPVAEAATAEPEAPATEAAAPATEAAAPAAEAEAPATEAEAPATEAAAPAAEAEAPATEAAAPATEAEAPAAEAAAPAAEAEAPAAEAAAPAAEAAPPAAEAEAPAAEAATPAHAARATKKAEAPVPSMAEPGFAELLDQSLERTRPIKQGDRLRAVVQRIEDDVAFLDYGGTSEAVIDTRELKDADDSLKFGVGDRIDVTVSAVGDQVKVNRMVKKARDRSVLREAWKSGATVEGKITGTNKGGFDVQISGFRAFCPISQIDRVYCSDPQAFVGQSHPFRIIEYKEGGRRVVVSRRVLIEEERHAQAEATRANLKVGDELEGKVVRLQPFGAFVDIGGIDGLVHVSELRHARVTNPADVVSVGQTLRVKVIQIEKLGEEKGERISLSAKALEIDPWTSAEERLQVGTTVQGRVLRLMNYGAFVEVLPGVEGLLHVSEVSNQKVRHPRDVVKEGETVDVRIIELDPGRKRLSLSMRSPDAEREAGQSELDVGTSITGTVSSIKPYGVFVRIVEPVTGVDGLLPIEETGLPRGTDLSQKFPAGSEVRAEVLRVDDRGRIRLTVRSAEERALDRERGARSSGEGASEGGRDGRRASRRDARREPGGAESQEESKEGKPAAQGLGIMANAFKRVLGQR